MNKNNIPALTEKHNAPERHRAKPESLHHMLHAQHGHCYCKQCGAIGFQKRWYIDPVQLKTLQQNKGFRAELCPGCMRVEQQQYEGEVILSTSRGATLLGEMMSLI